MHAATSSGVPARRAGSRPWVAVHVLDETGLDEPRGDRIHRDASAGDLDGDRAVMPISPAFAAA